MLHQGEAGGCFVCEGAAVCFQGGGGGGDEAILGRISCASIG